MNEQLVFTAWSEDETTQASGGIISITSRNLYRFLLLHAQPKNIEKKKKKRVGI